VKLRVLILKTCNASVVVVVLLILQSPPSFFCVKLAVASCWGTYNAAEFRTSVPPLSNTSCTRNDLQFYLPRWSRRFVIPFCFAQHISNCGINNRRISSTMWWSPMVKLQSSMPLSGSLHLVNTHVLSTSETWNKPWTGTSNRSFGLPQTTDRIPSF
jgi:hypothetical protein